MADLGNTAVISPTDANNGSGTMPSWLGSAAPSTLDDAGRALQGAVAREWQNRSFTVTSTGTAPTFAIAYTVAPAAYRTGQIYSFIAHAAAAGTDTANVNALGAKSIKKLVAGAKTATAANDWVTGEFLMLAYDGTDLVIVNRSGDMVSLGSANAFTGANTHAGTETFNSTTTIAKELALTGDITPAQITANQNDYAPTGHATASVMRLSSDAGGRTITGLAGGTDGRIVILYNVGNFAISLEDNGAGSSAANRFRTIAANWSEVPSGGAAILIYDGTASLWQVIYGFLAASQTSMEAGTSGSLVVTPATAQYHASAAKCWGEFLANSTTILKSYNITSVADTATGQMTVTIATDFSDANWACFITRAEDDLTLVYSATYSAKAAGTVILNSVVEAGGASDPTAASGNASWSFAGFGDL